MTGGWSCCGPPGRSAMSWPMPYPEESAVATRVPVAPAEASRLIGRLARQTLTVAGRLHDLRPLTQRSRRRDRVLRLHLVQPHQHVAGNTRGHRRRRDRRRLRRRRQPVAAVDRRGGINAAVGQDRARSSLLARKRPHITGGLTPAATCTYAACAVCAFAAVVTSERINVQPAGAVTAGAAITSTTATNTSPDTTPAGAGSVNDAARPF